MRGMKILRMVIADSRARRDLLTFRLSAADTSATRLKEAIAASGFSSGDEVVLVPAAWFDELDRGVYQDWEP